MNKDVNVGDLEIVEIDRISNNGNAIVNTSENPNLGSHLNLGSTNFEPGCRVLIKVTSPHKGVAVHRLGQKIEVTVEEFNNHVAIAKNKIKLGTDENSILKKDNDLSVKLGVICNCEIGEKIEAEIKEYDKENKDILAKPTKSEYIPSELKENLKVEIENATKNRVEGSLYNYPEKYVPAIIDRNKDDGWIAVPDLDGLRKYKFQIPRIKDKNIHSIDKIHPGDKIQIEITGPTTAKHISIDSTFCPECKGMIYPSREKIECNSCGIVWYESFDGNKSISDDLEFYTSKNKEKENKKENREYKEGNENVGDSSQKTEVDEDFKGEDINERVEVKNVSKTKDKPRDVNEKLASHQSSSVEDFDEQDKNLILDEYIQKRNVQKSRDKKTDRENVRGKEKRDESDDISYYTGYERDNDLSQKLKKLYSHRCQVCGDQRMKDRDRLYSETHHIKPRGEDGPDVEQNILVVCPNHHRDLDRGMLSIDAETLEISHLYEKDVNGSKLLKHKDHNISEEFLEYHNQERSKV